MTLVYSTDDDYVMPEEIKKFLEEVEKEAVYYLKTDDDGFSYNDYILYAFLGHVFKMRATEWYADLLDKLRDADRQKSRLDKFDDDGI